MEKKKWILTETVSFLRWARRWLSEDKLTIQVIATERTSLGDIGKKGVGGS